MPISVSFRSTQAIKRATMKMMMRLFTPTLLLVPFIPTSTGTSRRTFGTTSPLHVKKRFTFSGRKSTSSLLQTTTFCMRGGAALSDVESELVDDAFEWVANLGAPAALVAGAVFATLMDGREDMAPHKNDSPTIQFFKKATRMLMLSSFALEIISIFVTTVTGTMLLSHGDRAAGSDAGKAYFSPMGFLRHNLEFEYLTARITFLQGLLNWLAAVALETVIPKEDEGIAARRMNLFISSALVTIVLAMLSFYNHHMTFYGNYLEMLKVYIGVVWERFVWNWPPRPMAWLYMPGTVVTCVLGYRALMSPPEEEKRRKRRF